MDGDCYCQGCLLVQGPPGSPCDDGSTLTVLDIVGAWGQCYGWSNFITGQVFLDLDLSGTFNVGDVPLANRVVQASPGANYGVTDASGNFSIGLVGPAFYTLTPASGSFDVPSQVWPAIDLSVPGTTSAGNALAMNAVSAQADLSAMLTAGGPRPGAAQTVHVSCKNEGTVAVGGTLTFTFDAQQATSFQWPAGVVGGNTITWTVPVLQPSEQFLAYADITTPMTAIVGSVLPYSAAVATTPADAVPANDVYNLGMTVVNSFDPNDMQVTPSELTMADLNAGTVVTYTIRFQNTGTAAAENVRITNVIPLELRSSSFEFLASSHPCQAQVYSGLLQFRFDGIMLPDSTSDEPNSHGWVMFRMRPQNFLLPGASVYNSASIYFDFNEPVYTNTAVFEVEDLSTGVPRPLVERIRLWPNPAQDVINVAMERASGPASLTILDMHGRRVTSPTRMSAGTLELPVSGLPEGMYTLRVEQADGQFARRFVVSR